MVTGNHVDQGVDCGWGRISACAQKIIRTEANSRGQEIKTDSSVHVTGLTWEERQMVRPITASTCRLSLRLRLKVHSSQVGPWLASCVRQRRRLLPSFSTGGRSNCMDGRVLSILGRQRNSLRCGICETDLLLSLLLPGSVENITNQLLPLSHWAWTELQSPQHSLLGSRYQFTQDGT